MNINMLIGGTEQGAKSGATYERHDPVTGKVASRAAAAKAEDALAAVKAAQDAFPAWSALGPTARRQILLKAADALEAHVDDFIKLVIEEIGGTGPWAGFNVMLAASMLREAASLTTQLTGEVIPTDKPNCISMAIVRPVGVVLGIAPWNAPIILATRAVATPLACGNTVILKASEACPGTHQLIGKVLTEAGLPKGVINVVTNAPEDAHEVVSTLIKAPEVKRISFTGSTRVGRIISELAGKNLKPVLLELGGKAPMIVLDDADIDAAVNSAAFGMFMNQGQICMSTERLIVDEKIADKFVEKLAAKANALPAGNPREHVVLGALVNVSAAERMDELVADAIEKGAKKVAGGARDGAIVPATLLDNVTDAMKIYKEESFGPVKPIIRVKSDEEAIRVANDTEYGLSSSVFSQNIQRALAVAERLETGMCHINGSTVQDEAQIPFGGVKASGHGRFGGKWGIAEFTETRWITIEDPNQHYPF